MPSSSESANAKVKSCVIVSSSVFLIIQIVAFVATIVFYLFASSLKYRDEIANLFLHFLYPEEQRDWLRGERALEVRFTLKTWTWYFIGTVRGLRLPAVIIILFQKVT